MAKLVMSEALFRALTEAGIIRPDAEAFAARMREQAKEEG